MVGCTHEEENIFDDSAAVRVQKSIAECYDVLTSASNGWVMEYYPEAQQSYGGYNMLLKFDKDGTATVACDMYEATDVTSSLYQIKQSAGALLTFDTYNEIFHAFSDPGAPLGGDNGYGLEGDYEFLILSAAADTVKVKGKKSGNIMCLTPVPAGESWEEFITSIQEAEETMANSSYRLDISDFTATVSQSNRVLYITYGEGEDAVEVAAPFIQTKTGFKFYAPIELNGVTITELTYNESEGVFYASDNNSVVLTPVIPPINQQFINGTWFFNGKNMDSLCKAYFNMAVKGSANEGEEIAYMYMGKGSNGFAFYFNSGGYAGWLGYKYTLIEEDQVSIAFAMSGDSNGIYYHNNCNYNYPLTYLGYSSAKTWRIEADNLKSPSSLKLINVADETQWFILSSSPVYYPFR